MEKDELYQEEVIIKPAKRLINAILEAERKEWKKYAELLEIWLKGDAECPCCRGTKKCLKDCTYTEDDPDDAERMINIREILALRPKK